MQSVLEGVYENLVEEKNPRIKIKRNLKKMKVNTLDKQFLIFITVSNNNSQTYIVRGQHKDLSKAIEIGINNYLEHKPTKKFTPRSIKLEIVTDIYPVKNSETKLDISKDKVSYDRGLEGLAFGPAAETAFLPAEVAGYSIIRRNKIHLNNSFRAIRKHLPSTFTNFTKPLDEDNIADVHKFKTKEYYIDKNGFHELYRGHRTYADLSKKDLRNAIRLTKNNYFKNVVQTSGKYIYSFFPHLNKREKRYNILRHAGTTYSMLETYELMPDDKLLAEAERAFDYLFARIKSHKVNGKRVKVVVEKDAQKLGGNALAIVALAKYTHVTGDNKHIQLMQDLASWIKEVQGDDGEFTIHKQGHSTGQIFNFVSHYYPGEAILALVRLYQIDKNKEWLDVAEKAANFLINTRDKNDTIDTIAHDHWLLYALNDLYRERKKDMYLKHSFFIAEAMMKTQISEEGALRQELIGGYVPKSGNEPSSTPVACRSEGLSAVYNLANDFGHEEMAKKAKYAVQQGIKFQLQMHLGPESVMFYKRRKLCLGAVQAGLKSLSLRNDFTQHNISSFIAYYNILNKSK